jgi:hypothetical protein
MPTNDGDDDLFGSAFGSSKPPVEPNAKMRNGMAGIFEMYTGALNAGFNPVQAMQVTLAFITKG